MKTITPELAEELERLYSELSESYSRGAALLRTGGKHLEGAQLAHFLEEDAVQSGLIRRIKEIQS